MIVKDHTNLLRDRQPPLGNLMSAAARRLAAELDAGLKAAGFADISAAYAPIFQTIEPAGSRASDLAERAGMSKQAMGELVRHLTARGYAQVDTDPTDRRAKVVSLTEKGWEAVEVGARIIDEFDARLNEALGAKEVAHLRETLTTIASGAGAHYSHSDAVTTEVMRLGPLHPANRPVTVIAILARASPT